MQRVCSRSFRRVRQEYFGIFSFLYCICPTAWYNKYRNMRRGGGTAVSYSVSCEEDDVFGDYYNLDADYSKVGAGKM